MNKMQIDGLKIKHIELREAQAFVQKHHRHHRPPSGHRFSIGATKGGRLVGTATAGRPVARLLDTGLNIEITRLCTDGTRNACTFLLAAVVRAARALGYEEVITYTLKEEENASLQAAGWENMGTTKRNTWSRTKRPRPGADKGPIGPKRRWRKIT